MMGEKGRVKMNAMRGEGGVGVRDECRLQKGCYVSNSAPDISQAIFFFFSWHASAHLIEEFGGKTVCSHVFPLLSICAFCMCVSPFLPEGETIFWMSRVLINGCQQSPCQSGRSFCATEGVCVCNRDGHTDRKMLAACLSLLVASVISTRSLLHRSTCEIAWHLDDLTKHYRERRLNTHAIHSEIANKRTKNTITVGSNCF